jgi:hypothetical protein
MVFFWICGFHFSKNKQNLVANFSDKNILKIKMSTIAELPISRNKQFLTHSVLTCAARWLVFELKIPILVNFVGH